MMQNASLIKRYVAALYDVLSLIAIWLLCTLLFEMLASHLDVEWRRTMLQFILWGVTGAYFVICWVKTGQTLATQAWKIKLVNAEGDLLNIQQASFRYVLTSLSFLTFGAGFFWALVDREHLFLHDRILKTRLIVHVERA